MARAARQDIWFVYQFTSASGEVIYVGCTKNFDHRIRTHRSTKAWWPDVANIQLRYFNGKAEALSAERDLLARLAPIHNVDGTPAARSDVGHWPEQILRFLGTSTHPMTTTEVRVAVGYMNTGAVIHRLHADGAIKACGWTATGCRSGWMGSWATIDKPWPATERPDRAKKVAA